ncbi:hypothetical protein P691DRAFT_135792 [Macrolepiota fuliginosa MF-IS2]|uniref:Uncharacterized protein n=1 Tax=Macrolepiota fuliginosa MF-IS2 TaxID=1400762 RepID=A0A9P5XPQ6_9AGAR|nr:hypothetical protein P691DRAFT_135792 [Macrolepiota fuliginosa MF-IS2]
MTFRFASTALSAYAYSCTIRSQSCDMLSMMFPSRSRMYRKQHPHSCLITPRVLVPHFWTFCSPYHLNMLQLF